VKAETQLPKLESPWSWKRGLGYWSAEHEDGSLVTVTKFEVVISGSAKVTINTVLTVAEANDVDGLRESAKNLAAAVREMSLFMAKVADEATAVELQLWKGTL
jgi:hypothetical protein